MKKIALFSQSMKLYNTLFVDKNIIIIFFEKLKLRRRLNRAECIFLPRFAEFSKFKYSVEKQKKNLCLSAHSYSEKDAVIESRLDMHPQRRLANYV